VTMTRLGLALNFYTKKGDLPKKMVKTLKNE